MSESTASPGCSEALSIALDLGEKMVQCGAEINRVENTIERICAAYGYKKVDCFSITSLIIATVRPENAEPVTQVRRIYNYTTNLNRLEKLNSLSRSVCSELPDLKTVRNRINAVFEEKRAVHPSVLLGYMLSAAAFAVFFGGTLFDALATVPISAVQFTLDTLIKRKGVNRILFTVIPSAISGVMAIGFTRLVPFLNQDKIIIGCIMPLIPGLQLTNSLREMFCGDTMSGFIRLLEALMISVAIALGFAVPLIIFGGLRG
ncbi:MAG: threonine/serine exporter family protein [Clostridia bacterium]|nr:threonine/serine exporter family protein [Clostridia bacterium]